MTEKEEVEVLPDPCFPLPHVGFPRQASWWGSRACLWWEPRLPLDPFCFAQQDEIF